MTEAELLAQAVQGDERAFEQLAATYRRELKAHCYRMLGSPHDAEDAVQETLLNAWRGLHTFQHRSSFRTWLYRIGTNACLKMNTRRLRSPDHAPPRTGTADLGDPIPGPVWLEPWPDDPADSYLQRESVELAFVAALQHLPGTQRAVLILRDVLQYSAAEVAEILDTTPASVNSALQRARETTRNRIPPMSQQAEQAAIGEEGQRQLVDALIKAWESADVDMLLNLLAEDARFTMPPLPAWFDGRDAVLRFFTERVFETPWRLLPIRANGQLALACYQERLGAIAVLSLRAGQISEISGFIDPAVHRVFGVPEEFPPDR
jgi:RNA polymerase sigma-70 factor (TIGR02960 family)